MKKLFSLSLFVTAFCFAQEQQPLTAVNGNCRVFFNLSVASSGAQATPWLPSQASPPAGSAGTSLVIDNHQPGCYGWTMYVVPHGFSALSLSLQSAPDNSGGTAPGTWSTVAVCGGTECLGINPQTATTPAVTTTKKADAWFRVNLTSKTGTGSVEGVLYGYKVNIVANGGAPAVGPGLPFNSLQYNCAGAFCGDAHSSYNSGTGTLTFDTGGSLVAQAHNAMGALGTVNGNGPTLGNSGDTPIAYSSINTLKQSIGNIFSTPYRTATSAWTVLAPDIAALGPVYNSVNYIEATDGDPMNPILWQGPLVASYSQVDLYSAGSILADSAAVIGNFYNQAGGAIVHAVALDGYVANRSVGSIATAIGDRGIIENFAGAITDAQAGFFYVANSGQGTITNAYGIWIRPTQNFSTGEITNGYGIYIQSPLNLSATPVTFHAAWFNENQVKAGITESFSWYSEGGTNHLETGGAAVVGMELEAHAGQTANLFECLASDGVTINCAWGPDGRLLLHSIAFASLATPGNGSEYYCTDCTVTSGIDNTCAGTGAGAFAQRINGAWKCAL